MAGERKTLEQIAADMEAEDMRDYPTVIDLFNAIAEAAENDGV